MIKDCTEYAVQRGRCMKCYYGSRQGTKRGARVFKDIDYYHKLNKEELQWIQKFVAEEYDNNIAKVLPLNKTKEERKIIYKRDYKRRVDITLHERTPIAIEELASPQSPENALIELIDLKAQLRKQKK